MAAAAVVVVVAAGAAVVVVAGAAAAATHDDQKRMVGQHRRVRLTFLDFFLLKAEVVMAVNRLAQLL